MTRYYGRTASLVVGPLRVESDGEHGLRVAFQITKTTKLTENTARIRIFNLSSDTRSRLDKEAALVGRANVVRRVGLEAGYGDDRRRLFLGDKVWIGHKRDGVDWITTIESLDGASALSSQVAMSFAPGATALDVLKTIKDKIGLTWDKKDGDVVGTLRRVVYEAGKVVAGSARGAISGISSDAGLEASVQDLELLLHLVDGETVDTGLILAPSTGLVGTPERFMDPALKQGKKSKRILIRGKSLLNGRIAPGRTFTLEAEGASGFLRAIRVEHMGDTHGGDESWITGWEAEQV